MTVQHCALKPCKDLYFPLQVKQRQREGLSRVQTAQIKQTPASARPKPPPLNPKSQSMTLVHSPRRSGHQLSQSNGSLPGALGGPSCLQFSFYSREWIATSVEWGMERATKTLSPFTISSHSPITWTRICSEWKMAWCHYVFHCVPVL